MNAERLVLEDELIDGSTVVTEFDVPAQCFRTVHTTKGVPILQRTWPTADAAQQGHSQVLRELTATITTTPR